MTSYRVQTRAKSETDSHESYCIEASGRELCIDAESSIACEFAKATIHAARQTGCLNDILGEAKPLFSQRTLWISDTTRFRLPSLLEVDLPSWFQGLGDDLPLSLSQLRERCAQFTASLFELGLNTVIFSARAEKKTAQSVRISWKTWQTALDAIRSSGIKVALHFYMKQEVLPVATTEDWKEFFAAITTVVHSFDSIFWQAGELWQKGFQPQTQEATEYERAKEEVRFIEKNCQKPMIYVASSCDCRAAVRQAEWLWTLAHETGKETTLAFSATVGKSFSCHLPLHPFFQKLSEMTVKSYPRLLPVMGIGQVSLDSTVNHDIPHFAFDLYDNVLGRQIHERFYGIACMTPRFPEPGSLNDLVLWVLGQRMWRPLSLKVFIEMWLKRYHPQLQPNQAMSLFSRIDALLCHLDQIEETKNEHLKKKLEMCTFALSELAMQAAEISDERLKTLFLLFVQKMKKRLEESQTRNGKNYK